MRFNEEIITKLKEVVEIIQFENGKLLHELQFIKHKIKTEKYKHKDEKHTSKYDHDDRDKTHIGCHSLNHDSKVNKEQLQKNELFKKEKEEPEIPGTILSNSDLLKKEAIMLNAKISSCDAHNVKDLESEQKNLIQKAIGISFSVVILNKKTSK